MAGESKQKAVHYKRAVIKNSCSSLQTILEDAVGVGGAFEKVDHRQEYLVPGDDTGGARFINKSTNFKTLFFGQLISFEKGRSQALLTMNGNVSFYNIKSITSSQIAISSDKDDEGEEQVDGAKREFVDSFLYFGVYGNHLVMMQSSALRSKDLETHLNWLLKSAGVLDSTAEIILQDKPTEEAFRQLQNAPVKSIKIGAPVKGSAVENASNETSLMEVNQVRKIKFMPEGKGGDVIAAAVGENWVEKLDLKEALDEANLQVQIEITYLRKTTKRGQQVIDSIATSLRHMDDEDFQIELKGGGVLAGKDLRLSGNLSVKYHNGLVDEDDLYLKMHKWLNSKISLGDIDEVT